MKAIGKIIVACAAIGFVFALTSCNRHTCPTYSQANSQQTEQKV